MNIKWKYWKRAYPFICDICDAPLWENRDVCESCGREYSIREMTKNDYKRIKG